MEFWIGRDGNSSFRVFREEPKWTNDMGGYWFGEGQIAGSATQSICDGFLREIAHALFSGQAFKVQVSVVSGTKTGRSDKELAVEIVQPAIQEIQESLDKLRKVIENIAK